MAVAANCGHVERLQYNSVHFQVCIIISSSTNRLFSEQQTTGEDYVWNTKQWGVVSVKTA